jgi:hypothetical protein
MNDSGLLLLARVTKWLCFALYVAVFVVFTINGDHQMLQALNAGLLLACAVAVANQIIREADQHGES